MWTTGKKRSITHDALIAKGGFGEVHKVGPPETIYETMLDEERKIWAGRIAVEVEV